ncbi:MAG: hypothetical protein V4584_02270 [Verrucomicrobiota bacterium]
MRQRLRVEAPGFSRARRVRASPISSGRTRRITACRRARCQPRWNPASTSARIPPQAPHFPL